MRTFIDRPDDSLGMKERCLGCGVNHNSASPAFTLRAVENPKRMSAHYRSTDWPEYQIQICQRRLGNAERIRFSQQSIDPHGPRELSRGMTQLVCDNTRKVNIMIDEVMMRRTADELADYLASDGQGGNWVYFIDLARLLETWKNGPLLLRHGGR